jgi:DNA mismatch repair protein MutL
VHQLIVSALRSRLAAALGPAAAAGIPPASGVAERPPAYGTGPSPGAVRLVPMEPPAPASPEQATLWHPAPEGFAGLRFVGQVLNGYLLCEGTDRVVLIDQHAAHERVRFERLRAEHANGAVARDALLVPEAVALPAVQVAALAEHECTLAAAGLEGEPFGDGTFLLRTVPRLLRGHDVGALLRALASELVENGASMAAGHAADAVLATLACHSAVRVGQRLGPEQVRALLDSMDTVDVNAHCPHGRPVAVELSRTRLESLFGR